MSRRDFAEVTGWGEATLNRWENGLVIQNRANDRYLRLLDTPWTMQRLRQVITPEPVSGKVAAHAGGKQFRALAMSGTLRAKQAAFQLRV
jgi:hypothetical protein